jgi:hypothetical protein
MPLNGFFIRWRFPPNFQKRLGQIYEELNKTKHLRNEQQFERFA